MCMPKLEREDDEDMLENVLELGALESNESELLLDGAAHGREHELDVDALVAVHKRHPYTRSKYTKLILDMHTVSKTYCALSRSVDCNGS